jgi:hypothetical protein
MPSGFDQLTDLLKKAIDLSQGTNQGEPVNTGQATGLQLDQNRYAFNYTVFPSDLGMDDNPHYMIININVPTQGVKTNGLDLGAPAGAFTGGPNYSANAPMSIFGPLGFQPLDQVSKLDVLRYGHLGAPGAPNAPYLSIPRNTRRIAESIVLHMPQGLIYKTINEYENIELTSLGGKVGLGAAVRNATTVSKLMQKPINPAVEILFANTQQREFTFDLLLAPRNEEESRSIHKIYTTLKFHGAPEVNPSNRGATWIPPAEFDITFFHFGRENLKIPRINTCVLEQIVLDPMPQGMYSTFSNGYPVAWRLGLGFRELEPVHKLRVLQGF